jgi:hypothetical protein
VKPAYHGIFFGLLMLKTITQNFFEMIRNESPSASRHGLVFCVTHPPQFSHIGSFSDFFEYEKDPCVEHVMQQIEHWSKGMLSNGKLYSHKCVRLPCSFSIL